MRLTHPSIQPAGQSISSRFDERAIEAREGETIAAAPALQRARKAVARAAELQKSLWSVFDAAAIKVVYETTVCRGEAVSAARLRAAIASGLASLPGLNKATRAGMGRYHGRFCAAAIARLCAATPEADGFAAPAQAPGLPAFYNTVRAIGYILGPVVRQVTAEAILRGETIDPRYRVERFG